MHLRSTGRPHGEMEIIVGPQIVPWFMPNLHSHAWSPRVGDRDVFRISSEFPAREYQHGPGIAQASKIHQKSRDSLAAQEHHQAALGFAP